MNSLDAPQFRRRGETLFDKQRHSRSSAVMSDKKQTVDLGLLEEDDEFEEFPAEGK